MKQRITALLLALALMLSLGAVSALAEEQAIGGNVESEEKTEDAIASDDGESLEEHSEESAESAEDNNLDTEEPETEKEPVYLAGPDREAEIDPETGALIEAIAIVPDALGTVTFANMERRLRENHLQLLAIEENVLIIEEIDYDELYEDLRKQLNEIAQAQWGFVTLPDGFMSDYEKDKSYDQLDQAYDAVRETFDAIKEGELQKDNADAVWQLNSLENQIVMAGEALYVALAGMEIQEASLQRQLAAMNRTVEEMELRYQMGQISALQLSQAKMGQSSLASGLKTLQMNIYSYKLQLEMFIGAEQTGQIQLGAVPAMTEEELVAMDVEQDLLTAKEKSYDLYAAALTLEDAKEVYDDAGGDHYSRPDQYEYKKAKHTWNSAQYTYNHTIQEYERKFRTLYAQVQDCYQIWENAKVSLACEESNFKASELKYRQGTISQNAYLDAQDSLTAAEETVRTAANDLFSTYNTYCWAVQTGILN